MVLVFSVFAELKYLILMPVLINYQKGATPDIFFRRPETCTVFAGEEHLDDDGEGQAEFKELLDTFKSLLIVAATRGAGMLVDVDGTGSLKVVDCDDVGVVPIGKKYNTNIYLFKHTSIK